MFLARRHGGQIAEIKAQMISLERELDEALDRIRRIGGPVEGVRPETAPEASSAKAELRGPDLRSPAPSRLGLSTRLAGRVRESVRYSIYGPVIEPASFGRAGSGTRGAELEPILAFVHIPKTAGGSVAMMFLSAFSRQGLHNAGNYMHGPDRAIAKLNRTRSQWERWQQKGGRALIGHVPFAVFSGRMPPGARYLTFLREPIDRVVSHYYRHVHRRDPSRAGSPKELQAGRPKADSLEEALLELRLPQLSNLQTRFLCDSIPAGDLGERELEQAKASLEAFFFVGLQERFDESVAMLRSALRLSPAESAYESRHVNADRPGVEELPGELRELIAAHNRLDIELYEHGQRLFEQRASDWSG